MSGQPLAAKLSDLPKARTAAMVQAGKLSLVRNSERPYSSGKQEKVLTLLSVCASGEDS